MKKADYYQSTLNDLKKEHGRETQVLRSLNEMHAQLQCQGYQPLDPLEGVIQEMQARHKEVKGAIKRLEELIK